jgi:hypothetical protein
MPETTTFLEASDIYLRKYNAEALSRGDCYFRKLQFLRHARRTLFLLGGRNSFSELMEAANSILGSGRQRQIGCDEHVGRIAIFLKQSPLERASAFIFTPCNYYEVPSLLASALVLHYIKTERRGVLKERNGQGRLFPRDALCHRRAYGTVTYSVNSRRPNASSSPSCTIGTSFDG